MPRRRMANELFWDGKKNEWPGARRAPDFGNSLVLPRSRHERDGLFVDRLRADVQDLVDRGDEDLPVSHRLGGCVGQDCVDDALRVAVLDEYIQLEALDVLLFVGPLALGQHGHRLSAAPSARDFLYRKPADAE